MNGWIDLENKQPKEGQSIIGSWGVWDGIKYITNCVGSCVYSNKTSHGRLTHWMPLPSPPDEVSKKNEVDDLVRDNLEDKE